MGKLDTSNWKKFKLEDLFDIHPTFTYKIKNRDLYKEKGYTPVLSNTSFNNGVAGYSTLNPTEKGNIITFSDTTTGTDTIFYQPDKFIGYPHVQGMYPTDDLKKIFNKRIALFIISMIRRTMGDGWTYSNKFTRKDVLNTHICLPIKTNDNNKPIIDPTHKYHPEGYVPDWKYMESYIAQIEANHIAQIEAYLKATELDNYELTEEEVKALSVYAKDDVERKKEKLDTSNWKKFKLEDLFDIKTTKGVDKNKINVFDKGTFEFIGRSSVNNGVQGYVEKLGYEPNEENTLSIVQVGKTCCLYRDKKWYASQNIFKLIPKFDHLNKIHYFIRTIIDKNLIYYEPAYVCPKLSDLEDLEIELPISSTIDPTHKYHPEGYIPDWKFMETYMKAIEKIVIKEVVDYKNEVLKTKKEICEDIPPAQLEDPDTLKEDEIKQIKKLLQKGMKKTELLELLKGNLDSM